MIRQVKPPQSAIINNSIVGESKLMKGYKITNPIICLLWGTKLLENAYYLMRNLLVEGHLYRIDATQLKSSLVTEQIEL